MEELARRIAGIEQPLLERSRAGPPPPVAREHLVDPADDRVGRRFDPPGGGPGAARRGARLIEQLQRAALGRVASQRRLARGDRRIQRQTEEKRRREAIEKGSHEVLASDRGAAGSPGYAPAAMGHAEFPLVEVVRTFFPWLSTGAISLGSYVVRAARAP